MTAAAIKRRSEHLLGRAGVYRPARQAYLRLLNQGHHNWRQEARGFYRQFVPRGGLVFDVGANVGNYTDVYLSLGAGVVAVEPNPELAERLRLRCGSRRLSVEQVALSNAEGSAELRLGFDLAHSSISDEWVDLVRADEDLPERWSGSVTVPVTTMDTLIARHGVPDFVKIDVEGAERDVLSGLNQAVPSISFEFQCPALDIARECVAKLQSLGEYELNFGDGEQVSLMNAEWSDADTLFAQLEEMKQRHYKAHGDIYLRTRR
jgi:FkbM family methyltransferase